MIQLLSKLRGFLMRIRHIAESNGGLRTIASYLNHAFLREDVLRELALTNEFQTWSTHRWLSILIITLADADLAQRCPPINVYWLDGEVLLIHQEMIASNMLVMLTIVLVILRLYYRTDYRRCGRDLETIQLFKLPHRQYITPVAPIMNVSNAVRLLRALIWDIPL